MARRRRIFTLLNVSTALLALTLLAWAHGASKTDVWTKERFFDRDGTVCLDRTRIATSRRGIAFEFLQGRFLFKRHALPHDREYFPDDSAEDVLRRDAPMGTEYSHRAYPMDDPWEFPPRRGTLGFFWERYVSGAYPRSWGPVVPGTIIGSYHYFFPEIGDHTYRCEENRSTFAIPWWLFAVFFSISPVWAIVRIYIRRRSPKPGSCRKCGYDLRATPDRCPECGIVSGSTSR